MPTADSVNLTALSESDPRNRAIETLQVHHATTTSLEGLRALMDPGGRTVSANYAMGNDGHLMLVVPLERRAFTSASSDDHRAVTVEVCNTTLGPEWGISDASHRRLGQLAAELHLEYGMPLDRDHIYGHNETPGSYATACPGPSMNLDLVVQYALEALKPTTRRKRATKVINYVKASTRGANGSPIMGRTLCATAGMSPGTPANWVEYTRGTNFADKGSEKEMAVLYFNQFGTHIPLSDAEWDRLKGQFLAPLATSGGGVVDVKPIAAAAEAGAKAGVTASVSAIAKGVNDDAATRRKNWT